SWWEEAIMLSAAYTFDDSPFLKKIFQKNDEIPFEENIFHEELILAGQYAALANAIRQPELSDEIIKRLKNVLVKTPYSLTREQILTVLIEMDKQEENDYLLGLLSDQTIKKNVQECIVNALRDDLKLPQHKAVVSELGLLLTKPEVDNDIRKYIVIKLGEQGDHSQIPLLLDMLANPNVDADVRCSIADTLRIPGSKHVISPLLNILKEAGDWNVRTHIVDALSSLGDDSLASSLRPLLTNPHMSIDEHVRIHLIDALGRLNDYSGVSQLLQMLLDPKTEQQERIHLISNVGKLIMGLDELEKRQIMANLASQLENDPEKYLCISLLLYQLGDYSRVNNLTQCLSSVSIGLSLRLYIASELVKSGNKLIYHQLFELLTQPLIETSIKKGIIDTVGSLGDAAMASALEPFMANSDIDLEIQAHIVNTLMLLGETSVVAKGLALLSNEAIEVQLRQQIADNLSIFGQHVQVEDLLQRLANRHIDKSVRRHIASTLGQLAGDESSVSALEKLLQTSDIKDDIHRALWEVKNRVNRRNGK
ncbi:MAG TPA: HEAT repeat domain-containing protein, partial [Ktedonobacteraceae bacterium]|nr:HEAT repeat domain-containing protein [Ktedonobacteraceae bacterium]